MRISDWSSDVCSSDLIEIRRAYFMPPGSLEAYFRKWESKWIEEQKDINNPKIPLTFITEHGELVYSDQKTLDLNKAKAVRAQRPKDARNRKAATKKEQEELKISLGEN